MSFEIYSPDYSKRYEIAHAISVQTSEYYNNIGKISINVPINDYNIKIFKKDSIVFNTSQEITYILKNIKIDTNQNRITANGYTTNSLLNKRIILGKYNVKNIEADCYSILNSNLRGLPRIKTAELKGLTDRTNLTLAGGEFLDEIMPILNRQELGHKLIWDYNKFEYTFEIYKGKDLSSGIHAVRFSEEQGTARNLIINIDDSIFKNVAYVYSEYKDKPITEVVGTAENENRFEAWFDVSLNPNENETEQEFRQRMQNHGAMELGKLAERQTFEVLIDATDFGKIFNLGDFVSCVSSRFGVEFNTRINGIKYKTDANGTESELILGKPILNAIGGLKING